MEPLKTDPDHTVHHHGPAARREPDSAPTSKSSFLELAARQSHEMRAVVYREYGSPDVLQLEKTVKPVARDDSVLVRIHAAAANPYDWHFMRGEPYFMRLLIGLRAPNEDRLGVDFAGRVEAVGKKVTHLRPGDEVFGLANGTFAEFVAAPADQVALKPASLNFEQAAAVPLAALTALQGLRDVARIEPGQRVLIIGASGGVGTFAVQIAKSFGAEVTGVCSTRNVEMVRSIGADHVFDYKREDYTKSGQQYDLIIDNVGNHSLFANRRVLKPDGTLVIVGGAKGNWLGPLMRPMGAMMLSPFVDQDLVMILAQMKQEDLTILADLMQAGKMTPVIDRSYRLNEVPAAIQYSEEGHARGKIVIDLE